MELKYSKAIVTVLLFAVMLHLGDGIKCNICDYENGDCVEGKIKQKDCEQNNFVCIEVKTVRSDNPTAVEYAYDCASSFKDSTLILPGIGILHATHCGTDLCNKVVPQTIGGKNTAAPSPTTPRSVLKTKPRVAPSNNEGKKQNHFWFIRHRSQQQRKRSKSHVKTKHHNIISKE